MGTLSEPVPVTGLAENFSPIPLMAPPPLGSDMAGGDERVSAAPPWALFPPAPAGHCVPGGKRPAMVSGRFAPFTEARPSVPFSVPAAVHDAHPKSAERYDYRYLRREHTLM